MKPVVYTAIYGGYDTLHPPRYPDDATYICFTDGTAEPCEGWWLVDSPNQDLPSDILRARFHKVNTTAFLYAATSIWIDANIELLASPSEIVSKYLAGGQDIALHRHPQRNSIYREIEICKQAQRDDPEKLDSAAKKYRLSGYPEEFGLFETGVLVRRDTLAISDLAVRWWKHVRHWTHRDQVSLPWCLWKLGIAPSIIPGNLHDPSDEFLYHPHKRARNYERSHA